MLTDHIDITTSTTTTTTTPPSRPPAPRPSFLRRVLRRMRGRVRSRPHTDAPISLAAAKARMSSARVPATPRGSEVTRRRASGAIRRRDKCVGTDRLAEAFRLLSEDERFIEPATIGAVEMSRKTVGKDECWSESELRSYSETQREFTSFSRRNDTDIEAARPVRVALMRGKSSRGCRRKSVENFGGGLVNGGVPSRMGSILEVDDSSRLLRMCKSTVTVSKKGDWEDFGKGNIRSRYRRGVDRRGMDRDEQGSECRSLEGGSLWRRALRGGVVDKEGVSKELSVASLPVLCDTTGFRTHSDSALCLCEKSFQSSTSSVALSLSSVTHASRASSIN